MDTLSLSYMQEMCGERPSVQKDVCDDHRQDWYSDMTDLSSGGLISQILAPQTAPKHASMAASKCPCSPAPVKKHGHTDAPLKNVYQGFKQYPSGNPSTSES